MEIGGAFLALLKPGLGILGGAGWLWSSSLPPGRFPSPPPPGLLETVLLFPPFAFSSAPAGGETTYQGERPEPWRPKESYSYLKDEGRQEDLLRGAAFFGGGGKQARHLFVYPPPFPCSLG